MTYNIIKKLPFISRLIADRDRLLGEREKLLGERKRLMNELDRLIHEKDLLSDELSVFTQARLFVPPGHYYSPIPSIQDIKKHENRTLKKIPKKIPGIDLREKEQLNLLNIFKPLYDEIPFHCEKTDDLRYHFENPAYSYSDAIFLYCMIRKFTPKKIIEVGSGYSSCVSLDTNELYFNNKIKTTFIEPYPDLFLSLIKPGDTSRISLIPNNLQEVSLDVFSALEKNDILFIDSTHVAKVDSDVTYIFSEILPVLAPGVFIHFHDIFFPFEYCREWIFENRAWNEIYLLKAFLAYNSSFEIVLFNTFLDHFHKDSLKKNMPLCLKNPGGSIWLQKTKKNV